MPMNRKNSQTFHRWLYSGQLETVVLLVRGDDQQEGTVKALLLPQCRRGNVNKTGEPIQNEMSSSESCQWLLPSIMLRRIGVNYINVITRIVDKYNLWWQPESPQTITMSQFDNYYLVECVRVDPDPNFVLLGIPGVGL